MAKRNLMEDEINHILDFIKPRPGYPKLLEEPLIERRRNDLKHQLKHVQTYTELIPTIKEELERSYYGCLMEPGESVGILSAQSMCEFSTQATLNTFHAAGLASGVKVNSGASRFQELINASKSKHVKDESLTIYFKERYGPKELKDFLARNLIEAHIKDLVGEMFMDKVTHNSIATIFPSIDLFKLLFYGFVGPNTLVDSYIQLKLNLNQLYRFKIEPLELKRTIDELYGVFCTFDPDTDPDGHLNFYIFGMDVRSIIQNVMDIKVAGVDHISNYYFDQEADGEWFIRTIGGTIRSIIRSKINHIVDFTRTVSTSVWDVMDTLGLEAVRTFYIDEMGTIMDGMDPCHFQLLTDYMTHTSSIKATNRYTMRGEQNTLNKLSFEAPCETIIKAVEYRKEENFNGVSASIMLGKKVNVGTYMFDLTIDYHKLLKSRPSMVKVPVLDHVMEDDELEYVD